jgi:Spy/CpxP family protein refolding chaperone
VKQMNCQNPFWQFRSLGRPAAIFCAAALLIGAFFVSNSMVATSAMGQSTFRQLKQQRRQERMKRQIERQGGNKLSPTAEEEDRAQPEAAPATESTAAGRLPGHRLDGISKAGIEEFFSREEKQLVIPGFGRRVAYLIILRQLDLSPEQKREIRALRQRIGPQLVELRQHYNRLDQELEDIIYGDNFDPKLVEELSTQAGQKQAEITKLQASIEAQFRQILTTDQFYVFRHLVGEMLLPQRRPQARPLQNQRRMGQPVTPQTRPNQQPPDDN